MDFSKIGLLNRDKRVYEALVHAPQSSVRKVADRTGINRGSTFESIQKLVKVGLVTRVLFGKRWVYRAKDPLVIHEIIDERQNELLNEKERVDSYAMSFRGLADDASLFHFTSSYEGDEGLAAILRDVLKTCRKDKVTNYRVISSPKISTYLYNNFPYFTRERVRLGLSVRVLRQGKRLFEKADFAQSRYVDNKLPDTGCYILIYSQKVAIIAINSVNQTSGVIIDNQSFAAVQAHLFDVTWLAADSGGE